MERGNVSYGGWSIKAALKLLPDNTILTRVLCTSAHYSRLSDSETNSKAQSKANLNNFFDGLGN